MSESTNTDRPESGMDTGSEAGSPGDRAPATDAPGDDVASAVADDAPLPPGHPGAGEGGQQDDGLAPPFLSPPD